MTLVRLFTSAISKLQDQNEILGKASFTDAIVDLFVTVDGSWMCSPGSRALGCCT